MAVIQAWAELPESVKTAVMKMGGLVHYHVVWRSRGLFNLPRYNVHIDLRFCLIVNVIPVAAWASAIREVEILSFQTFAIV